MIKALIFDYDGVIVDSFPTLFAVYSIMCRAVGVTPPGDIEVFRRLYGYDFHDAYRNLGIPEDKYELVGEIYRRETPKQQPAVYPGIGEVLAELAKVYQLFLVSANGEEEVNQKLTTNNLKQYFTEVFADTVGKKTPKSAAFQMLAEKHGFTLDEAVSIGDRTIDYDAGIKAGFAPDHIFITAYGWGYDPATTPGAVRVESPQDIIVKLKDVSL